MIKRILPIFLALSLLLVACGSEGTPTTSAVDVQNTAIAAAWTMVAATQQAMPTNTPIPPTNTASPMPPPTFTPFPTQNIFVPTATTAASGDSNNCNRPLNMGEAGPTKAVRVENEINASSITLSLNIYEPNAFGQCGSLSYVLKGYEKRILYLPKGKWWAYAWIEYKNGDTSTSSGSFELAVGGGDDLVVLKIKEEVIVMP